MRALARGGWEETGLTTPGRPARTLPSSPRLVPALDDRADELVLDDREDDDDDAELTDPEPLRALHLSVTGDGGAGLLAAWDDEVAGRARARALAPAPAPDDQTLQLRPPAPRPRHKRVWAALRRALTSAFEPWQASAL